MRRLLQHGEGTYNRLGPDIGAGGYHISFYTSADQAYRMQLAGDTFQLSTRSSDSIEMIPGGHGQRPKHMESIGITLDKCPKWFTEKLERTFRTLLDNEAETGH